MIAPTKNKLLYKIYLNTISNAFDNEPVGFPRTSNIPKYCFKITKSFTKELTIRPRKGFNEIPHSEFYEEYCVTALNIRVTKGYFEDNRGII